MSNLSPTKQTLLELKEKSKLMAGGLKLLKEKLTGLIKIFTELATEGKALEKQLKSELDIVLDKYMKDLAFVDIHQFNEFLEDIPCLNLEVAKKRLSGVYVDTVKIDLESVNRPGLKPDLQENLDQFSYYFPLLIKLSQLKLNCHKLAIEIRKTNRKINNIERMMEENSANMRKIQQWLEELERSEKAVAIKVFGQV